MARLSEAQPPKWIYHVDNRKSTTRRESTLDDMFDSSALSVYSDIVRESIQNSLDARSDLLDAHEPVRMRFALGTLPWNKSEHWLGGAVEHLRAPSSLVKTGFHECSGRTTDYLCIEDFGTIGLQGDYWPTDELTAFNAFYRAEGKSPKQNGSRGSRGVGKVTFQKTSRLRLMFGLTIRETEDNNEAGPLLMGVSTNAWHQQESNTFTPDAQFGLEEVVAKGTPDQESIVIPISGRAHPTISQFVQDFGIARTTEPGLSAVVPFLKSGVSLEVLTTAIVEQYYVPILRGELNVEMVSAGVTKEILSLDNVASVAQRVGGDDLYRKVAFAKAALITEDVESLSIDIGTDSLRLALQHGDLASKLREILLVKKGIAALKVRLAFDRIEEDKFVRVSDEFCVSLKIDDGRSSRPLYLREGLTVANSDLSQNMVSGGLAIVEAQSGPLANLLRSSENGAHTQFQPRKEKVSTSFRPGDRVVSSFLYAHRDVMTAISASLGEKDYAALAKFFPDRGDLPGQMAETDDTGDVEIPTELPPSNEQPVSISKVVDGNFARITFNFTVSTGKFELRAATREMGVDSFKQQAVDHKRGAVTFSPTSWLAKGLVAEDGVVATPHANGLSLMLDVQKADAKLSLVEVDSFFDVEVLINQVGLDA